jgi:hypothetical protein
VRQAAAPPSFDAPLDELAQSGAENVPVTWLVPNVRSYDPSACDEESVVTVIEPAGASVVVASHVEVVDW